MSVSTSATIPYAPQLNNIDISEIAPLLDEVGVRISVEQLNWPEEYPYRPLTIVAAAHSGDTLYLDFFVRCNYLRAENYTLNSPVSEDSCVEFFIADPSVEDAYRSLCFNCIGCKRGKFHHGDRHDFLTDEQLDAIKVFPSVGTRPFQEVEGSFTWSVTVAIPLELIGVGEIGAVPTELRGNFNKCASATSQPHYLSWSPIATPHPDFHQPAFFAPLILAPAK